MATLESRLSALEQIHQKTYPELVLFYLPKQNGEPTLEQKEQIAQAEKRGQPVKILSFRIVEPKFLN